MAVDATRSQDGQLLEETLNGHKVLLLNCKTLPALVEVLPINVDCLGDHTCSKTKHVRNQLGSYTIDSFIGRAQAILVDGLKEIWLSSKGIRAYGCELSNLGT